MPAYALLERGANTGFTALGICIIANGLLACLFVWIVVPLLAQHTPSHASILATPFNPVHFIADTSLDEEFFAGLVLSKSIQSQGKFCAATRTIGTRPPRLEVVIITARRPSTHAVERIHLEPVELLATMQQITGGLNPYSLSANDPLIDIDLDTYSAHRRIAAMKHYRDEIERFEAKIQPGFLSFFRRRAAVE